MKIGPNFHSAFVLVLTGLQAAIKHVHSLICKFPNYVKQSNTNLKSTNVINTSKAIIIEHHSLNNWAGFNKWWQRKSKQMWLAKKRGFRLQLVCLLWPQREQQQRRPHSLCTNISTPSNSHTPTLLHEKMMTNPHVRCAFYIPFHFRPQIHPYVIT